MGSTCIEIICFTFYIDVAISAPFGDQPGTVYIYVGTGSNLLNQNPTQVITHSYMYDIIVFVIANWFLYNYPVL